MRTTSVTVALLVLAACSDPQPTRREPPREPPRERRVIEPPVGIVRPQPPHAIRADGVGPYKLGDKLSDLLAQLPSGPRLALLEIPGILHRSLIRTEDNNTLLIGGEPGGTASFVAVVGPEVARTESGVHVGSTRTELETALGPMLRELDRAHDPRIVIPSGLRNARAIIDRDRVAAFVITEAAAGAPREPDAPCPRPELPASTPGAAQGTSFGACLTGSGERVEVQPFEVTIRAVDGDRVWTTPKQPQLIMFAAPLRSPSGRDELVVVTRSDSEQQRTWWLTAYRIEGGKLARSIEPSPLYALTAVNVRWIGAELREVDLYLELASRKDGLEVGGLLTRRAGDSLADVVAISPLTIARKHGKSAPLEGSGAGATEGSVEVPQDAPTPDAQP